jgi:hypothetical protein
MDEIPPTMEDIRGRVLFPDDAGYEPEISGYQTGFVQKPRAVVAAAEKNDIAAAVRLGGEWDVPVGVQATGHGLAAGCAGGVLVTTSRLRGVRVDAGRRTAWLDAGARWADVIEAAAGFGLAPLSGSAPGVGAVGYTLEGGTGLLARRYGYAADLVTSADLVMADGRSRRVTADSDPDLFWAIRGAGANFGIVTGLEIGLVELDRMYGGGLYFAEDLVPEVLRAWLEWTAGVPDGMTSSIGLIPYPDRPTVPEPVRGRYVAHVRIAYAGGAAEGDRLVAPLRAVGPRLMDSLGELPYTKSDTIYRDPEAPMAYYATNVLTGSLDAAAAETVLALAGPGSGLPCVVQISHLGGALAAEPAVPSVVGHRDARYALRVLSRLDPGGGAEQAPALRPRHERVYTALGDRVLGRSLNFMLGGFVTADDVWSGYDPDDRERLAELKRRHDPRNLFRCYHNIPAKAPS